MFDARFYSKTHSSVLPHESPKWKMKKDTYRECIQPCDFFQSAQVFCTLDVESTNREIEPVLTN